MPGPDGARRGWREALLAGALVLVALATYSRVFGHQFLLNWDDLAYVVENQAAHGLTARHAIAAFSQSYVGNYAPLHILSYAVDWSLWGPRPGGFLLSNVLLHGACGALAFLLFLRLGMAPAAAWLGGALFVVHPVQVESVAWISERKNVLSMALSLVSLLAFAGYRAAGPRRAWAYAGSCLACVAALLTKAAAVVLPPLLVAYDLCTVEPGARRRFVLDKVPYALAAAAVVAATLASQAESIAEGRTAFRLDALTTVYTMVPVVATYLRLVAWPARLSALYTPAIREAPDLAFAGSLALLAAGLAIAVLLYRRDRRLLFWYAAFFIGLVPVLQIVPLPTLMNDRYLYFPMLGVAGLAAGLTDRALRAASPRRRAAWLAPWALLAPLAAASAVRTGAWRDDLTLWRDVAAKSPGSPLALVGLGMSLLDAGREDEALQALLRAVALDPGHRVALNDVGALYDQRGLPELGRPYLLRAVQIAPGYFSAHMNLAIGYRMSGDLAAAERELATALALRPDSAEASRALAEVRAARAALGR